TERYGRRPEGFLTYGRDGRMHAIIVAENRPKPADMGKVTDAERIELFKTLIAYSGTFTFDGTVATHHVDISWNGTYTGTAQLRNLKLEGRTLTISTNVQPGLNDGRSVVSVLTWEKME